MSLDTTFWSDDTSNVSNESCIAETFRGYFLDGNYDIPCKPESVTYLEDCSFPWVSKLAKYPTTARM